MSFESKCKYRDEDRIGMDTSKETCAMRQFRGSGRRKCFPVGFLMAEPKEFLEPVNQEVF